MVGGRRLPHRRQRKPRPLIQASPDTISIRLFLVGRQHVGAVRHPLLQTDPLPAASQACRRACRAPQPSQARLPNPGSSLLYFLSREVRIQA